MRTPVPAKRPSVPAEGACRRPGGRAGGTTRRHRTSLGGMTKSDYRSRTRPRGCVSRSPPWKEGLLEPVQPSNGTSEAVIKETRTAGGSGPRCGGKNQRRGFHPQPRRPLSTKAKHRQCQTGQNSENEASRAFLWERHPFEKPSKEYFKNVNLGIIKIVMKQNTEGKQ